MKVVDTVITTLIVGGILVIGAHLIGFQLAVFGGLAVIIAQTHHR